MKNSYKAGIIAVALATAFAVFAVENQPTRSGLVRLKVDGEVVAEMRILKGHTLNLEEKSQMFVTNSQRIIVKNATLRFGVTSDKSFTVKADEAEIIYGR